MSTIKQRLIQYAGSSVLVEYDHSLAETLLDLIVYPFPKGQTVEPHCTIKIIVNQNASPVYSLVQNECVAFESDQFADTAEILLSLICHQLAEKSQGGLLFHAAGLSFHNHGILLPGGIGAGKSTFTAWLLSKGACYLTDELVFIALGSNVMQSFARPLHLKKPSRPVLHQIVNYHLHHEKVLSSLSSDLVDPKLINPQNQYSQPLVEWVIFPHYLPEEKVSWVELSSAQTGLELMQTCINARNLADLGFSEIARLSGMVSGFKFNYSHFNQVEEKIFNLIGPL